MRRMVTASGPSSSMTVSARSTIDSRLSSRLTCLLAVAVRGDMHRLYANRSVGVPRTGFAVRCTCTTYRRQIMNKNRWALVAVALATFMTYLDNNIVNVALPDIQQELGLSTAGLEWVVSAF